MGNLWLAFITGLTTGGVSCFAVQGGLLTSALATQETADQKHTRKESILIFLFAKLLAYTLLGFVLGFLGSSLNLSPRVQGWLQIFVGLYLLVTAARLADVHPVFRYFVIQPPRFVFRLLKKQSQAAFLGALTVLIPCGITQAMLILAVTSSSPFWGAGIMFFFILGTSPVFFLIGLAAVELLKKKAFSVLTAILIAILGIIAINTGQILRGSVHTLQNYWRAAVGENQQFSGLAKTKNGAQEVIIYVTNRGYASEITTLKVGVPVKLTLVSQNVRGCARAFAIPEFNLFKILPQNGTTELEFTPTHPGRLTYTCSMGMYNGFFNIIE